VFGTRINRVFEVEEYMGGEFIEELSTMHEDHLKILQHNFIHGSISKNLAEMTQEKQKSLPAYIYGLKLAKMVQALETIKCQGRNQLKGGGKIIFDKKNECLRGELPRLTESSYFKYDKKRYLDCLENFKKGWDYYLCTLETDLIEEKLLHILSSLTFKYTRQPQFLIVTPERLKPENLRISEKIKLLNEEAFNDDKEKFFQPLSADLIDPEREMDVSA